MTKQQFENRQRVMERLSELGFTHDESEAMLKIERTLHRWSEQECGDGNEHCSWAIERDEVTGKPYRCVYPHNGEKRRYSIADREAGALRRLGKIVAGRNARFAGCHGAPDDFVNFYYQTDPRGCALYIVRRSDIPTDAKLDSYYTRGIAVAA